MHFLNNAVRRQVVVLSFVLAAGIAAAAQQQERTAVQDKYKWDLSRIYPTDQAWRAAKDTLAAQTPSVRSFKGTLTSSAQKLADALELNARLLKEYARLSTCASLMSDQDTRVSTSRRQRESHSAFFRGAGAFRGTFGATMNGEVQRDVFYAKTGSTTPRSRARSTPPTSQPPCTAGSSTA
jgi:oligoendopeptidase F